LRSRLTALTGLVLALAAQPATAAETTVRVGDDFFSPTSVQIAAGDTVNWVWEGMPHSVKTKPNQPESFDSDPGVPEALISHPVGFTFSHAFNTDGVEVEYLCAVHPFTMSGTVTVGTPAADTTAPAVTNASANVKRKKVSFAFNLSEAANVRLEVAKASKPRKVLKKLTRALAGGRRSLAVSRRGLKPGRYVARISATDEAGNASAVAKRSFRLKKPR
jgi:plastocyanin